MYYAEPRYTKDLDIVLGLAQSDIDGFEMALAEFGFPLTAEAVAELGTPNRKISLGRPPARIDILNEIAGVEFEPAWSRRRSVEVDGEQVSFISLEDLVAAKRAAGRAQDLWDLKSLEPLLNKPGA